jgi:putative FmdB family regulatory protein
MPTYEYHCTQCGYRYELFQRMSDEPRSACPSCGGEGKRLISAGAGIIVKGKNTAPTPCGNDSPCCGRGEPCGKSFECG